jgi:ABC-type spermidine/putrescine transport system permease subunit II
MDIKRKIVLPAVVGAVYAALTVLLAPISYGAVQFRLSEVLCILPFFLPGTAVGLFLGCALANTVSAAGVLDIVFGSFATLAAGFCTARIGLAWRRTRPEPRLRGSRGADSQKPGFWVRFWACLMPVLWNGAIVGAVLAYTLTPENFWAGFALIGAQVALGEAAVLLLIGLPLTGWLTRSAVFASLLAPGSGGNRER